MSAFLGWLLLGFQILFGIISMGIFFEFNHGKDVRNLLGATVFFGRL